MRRTLAIVLFTLITIGVSAAYGQQDDEAVRNRTREQLAQLLEKAGPTINVAFSQSQKQPYNYVGTLRTGLVNAESFEIVISVTAKETIGFRVYPHYKSGYINVDKINDRAALMRLLLRLSDRAFLFWGADETGDIFTGYTFTLESGFPEEAIRIVLRSIVNSDKFVGEMRPILDAPIEDVTLKSPTPPAAPPVKAAPAKAKVPLRRRRRGRT
jgi:hypothetical protein